MKFMRYPGYLKSDIAWIPEIPDTWSVKKIKFLFKVINGSTPKSGIEDYWDGDIVWVTPEDLGKLSSDYIQESERRITADGYKKCGTTLVPEGSIVLSTRAPIGHLAIASVELCTNQGCKGLIKNHKDISIKYYYYFLKSAKDILNSLGKGTTFVELGTYPLEALKVCLPATKVQDEIGGFLDEEVKRLDLIVAEYSNFLDLLKEKRFALITNAVTKGLNPNVRMKDSCVDWIGETPEHWEVKNIKYLCDYIKTGSTPPSENSEYFSEEEINWFTPGDFNESYRLTDSLRKVTKLAIDDGVIKIFKKDTILLVSIGTIGKIGILSQGSGCNQQINAIKIKHGNNPWYFLYYLVAANSCLIRMSNANLLGILNQEKTGSIKALQPTLDEQNEIVDYISSNCNKCDELIVKIRSQIDLLNEYKMSLISHAVTGKIDVRGYALHGPGTEDFREGL